MVVSAVPATEEDSTRRAAPTSFIPWMRPAMGCFASTRRRQYSSLPWSAACSTAACHCLSPSDGAAQRPTNSRGESERKKERKRGKESFSKNPSEKEGGRSGGGESSTAAAQEWEKGERVLHFLTIYPTVLSLQTLVSKRRTRYCWLSKWQFRQLASGA